MKESSHWSDDTWGKMIHFESELEKIKWALVNPSFYTVGDIFRQNGFPASEQDFTIVVLNAYVGAAFYDKEAEIENRSNKYEWHYEVMINKFGINPHKEELSYLQLKKLIEKLKNESLR